MRYIHAKILREGARRANIQQERRSQNVEWKEEWEKVGAYKQGLVPGASWDQML
jgi:hypothetical protein